jgi:hypothetical protein
MRAIACRDQQWIVSLCTGSDRTCDYAQRRPLLFRSRRRELQCEIEQPDIRGNGRGVERFALGDKVGFRLGLSVRWRETEDGGCEKCTMPIALIGLRNLRAVVSSGCAHCRSLDE